MTSSWYCLKSNFEKFNQSKIFSTTNFCKWITKFEKKNIQPKMLDITNKMLVCSRNVLPYNKILWKSIVKCRYLNAMSNSRAFCKGFAKTLRLKKLTSMLLYLFNNSLIINQDKNRCWAWRFWFKYFPMWYGDFEYWCKIYCPEVNFDGIK